MHPHTPKCIHAEEHLNIYPLQLRSQFFFVVVSLGAKLVERKSPLMLQTSKYKSTNSVQRIGKKQGKERKITHEKQLFRHHTPSVHHHPMHLCSCCVDQVPGLVASSEGQYKEIKQYWE
jgi:hypothetical protein